jgi:aromatic-L-amino-acid decarboxylase
MEVSPTLANPSCRRSAAWGGVFLALPELREECQLDAINARSKAINSAGGICASGEVHSFCANLHK